ncbi:hypothetical protein GGX14DRAFT_352007, partial [Mycena pura]
YVFESFNMIHRATSGSDASAWYGPTNTLLGFLFPPEQYEVAPHKELVHPDSGDFPIIFVVSYK